MFNTLDTGTTAFKASSFDVTIPFMGMKPVYAEEVEANYTVTELNNGFTVLTESQTFPGAINMGKY
jgi:hypothetical protein